MQNNTTLHSLSQTAANKHRGGSEWSDLAIYPSVTGLTPDPESDDDTGEPGAPEQAALPAGPTHVAARGTPRTKDQLASARVFLAAAGKVKFDRGRATLKAVWSAIIYYASLGSGPERVCFAQVKTLADRALVSERTIRTHLAALAGLGLIQTDHRTGGHAPTKWKVSPSVLGGRDCRAGRQDLPGRAVGSAAEVSNRSSAPTGRELLASKQQPDGACAPPSAEKNPPQKTTKEQPTQPADPPQALVQGKTDTGGVPRGGATEKQIKFLQLLADRVGAEPAEDLWRAADPKRLQVQIKAAVPFKARGEEHTHAAFEEVIFRVGIVNKIGFKEGVQRCECGAVRAAVIDRTGESTSEEQWALSGYLVDYLVGYTDLYGPMTDDELSGYNGPGDDDAELLTGRWAEPMTFSDVKCLYNSLPGERMTVGADDTKEVPADWNRVVSEAEDKARVAAEAKEKARVAAEAKEKARVAAEVKEKARVAAKVKEKAQVAHDMWLKQVEEGCEKAQAEMDAEEAASKSETP